MIILNNTLKIFLFFGIFLYGTIFIYSFTSPYKIEKNASSFIKEKIKESVDKKIDSSQKASIESKLINISNKFLNNNQEKLNELKENIANVKLTTFMKMSYMKIVQNIINDFKIFSGSNLLFFLIALILLFIRPKLNIQITLVASLLFISTIICSYFYIFEQNWFYNIMYQDFLGYIYLVYLGIVFLFLCDILFNKARITTKIIDFIINTISTMISGIS